MNSTFGKHFWKARFFDDKVVDIVFGHHQVQFVHVSYEPSLHVGPEQIRHGLQLQPHIFALLHPIAIEKYPYCVPKNHLLNILAMYMSYLPKVECKISHFRITYTWDVFCS